MERLTFDGNFCDIAQCRELPCPHGGKCTQRKVWEKLKDYEDTGLPPEVCANYKTFEDECISKGVTFGRIVELMNADAEGRLKIVPRAPKGTVCGSCVHFDRETGTAHGFCKTQTQMRVSAEFPSGRTEPRYVMQSRPACKGYEPLEEDDDGATD